MTDNPTPEFDRETWRRERMRYLETENLLLRGERDRYEQLLAQLLMWANPQNPLELLDTLCFTIDTQPGRAAVHQ